MSPEYLGKVEQIDPPKYGALLTKHLFVTPGELGRMVWLPSFQSEMVVSVYSTPQSNDGKAEKAYRLTVTRSDKSLWDIAESSSPEPDVRVSRRDTDIDAELAFAIQRAWRIILAKDPILTDSDSVTLDGFIAVFSVVMPDGQTVMREAANPDRAPATDLVAVGIDLSLYCTAAAEEQKSKRSDLVRRLQKLADTYQKP
jgi:hypothetical protein